MRFLLGSPAFGFRTEHTPSSRMESRQCILRRIERHSSRESPKSIRQAHCLIAGRLARERERDQAGKILQT
ncbi:UNVERIFIED_CONTAM: hypothetical protein Slati_4525300 [Sesamum latifolium]|uniref:Uncharacterized protein n=1 Tax=Sesamum latifolium TaxID=2727402 RepID=A0AAW2SGA3_9LAMI